MYMYLRMAEAWAHHRAHDGPKIRFIRAHDGPPWIQSNPFAAHLGPIGFQTTTININTNNRFLLPRGGLTVYIYIYIKILHLSWPPTPSRPHGHWCQGKPG